MTGYVKILRIWLPAIFLLCSGYPYAQDVNDYEETLISLKIPKIGVVEAPAYIKHEVLYLPVCDIFTFLKIQNTPSPGYDSISGFFINPESRYLIDRATNRIHFGNKVYDLNEGDMVRTETNLYLRSGYFGEVFGMNISFEFRTMTATLLTSIELPIIREMRLEAMRKDMSRLKGEIRADTTIGRKYPFFHFGMADWSVTATQQVRGRTNTWLTLSLGSILAGGEANISLSYSNRQPFIEKYQDYLWHYANNDLSLLRQVMLGKVSTMSISSLFSPLVGFQVTNTPTTFRRSFCTYTLSDYTEPGWIVELYVNNVMVDYLRADASGFFTFEVPLVYGTSSIVLRFYGPWGEERKREKSISIPFSFLPPKKLEYTVTAAMVENPQNDIFSRASVNYGLTRWMTFGGGIEYLSSVRPFSAIPYIDLSMRLASSLLISAEYDYGVRFKGYLSYHMPWNMQLELNYFKYHTGQTAISTNFTEERKVMISMPVRLKRLASLVRLTLDQTLLQNSRNLNCELLFSGNFYGVSANLTTFAMFYYPFRPYIYSTLSLGFRLPARFILIPQVQYDYTHKRLVSSKLDIERRMFEHGQLKISYERNFAVNVQNFQLGFRYDFPFAQAGLSAMFGKNSTSLVQSARGSILFDAKTKWVGTNNMTNVGRGGVVLVPFLDLNVNGKRDRDEPKVTGLNFRINAGKTEQNKRDSTIRVLDLEPFRNYFIEIDPASFDNVAWQIKKPVISVAIDPNQFKLVEIPVAVYGEAAGMVYIRRNKELTGLGRIIIAFYREDSTLAGRTLTEPDGYFSFLGLPPGRYFVKPDQNQMRKLNMAFEPAAIPITLVRKTEGDLADGLDFIVEPLATDTSAGHPEADTINSGARRAPGEAGIVPPDTIAGHRHLITSADSLGITIQAAVYREQTNAINAGYRVQAVTGLTAEVVFESDLYIVLIHGIKEEDEATRILGLLKEKGFIEAAILNK